MKKTILPVIAALIFTSLLQAQNFKPQWANCYSDPNNATLFITDMATDKTGNTYIVGYKTNVGAEYYDTHMFLRKVNTTGAEEWIQYFDTQLDSIDNAKAVALDKAGNIYVTGTRIDTFCNICSYPSKISDIITMKYNPQGTRLWLNRYAPGYQVRSSPTDIFVNPDGTSVVSGNELIFNAALGAWENTAVTQKITPAGGTVWINKVAHTFANSPCIDKSGNVVVAGAGDPYNAYNRHIPFVIKYSSAGSTVWSMNFDELNKHGDLYHIFTDQQNNVYVNGQSDVNAFENTPQILTLKIAGTTGSVLWSQKEQADSRTNGMYSGGFTLDAQGNSYVTGQWVTEGNDYFQDWLISKYNSNGVKQWTTFYNGPVSGDDVPKDIATDTSGNVYVTGYAAATANGKYYYALNVYNANGALLYQHLYHNANAFSSFPAGVELDKKGNVYITGASGAGNCTVKYKRLAAALSAESNISSVESKDIFSLFPNPVKDLLNIRLPTSSNTVVYTIFDGSGKRIIQQTLAAKPTIPVNVASLKSGTYLIQVIDGPKTYSSKFIKL